MRVSRWGQEAWSRAASTVGKRQVSWAGDLAPPPPHLLTLGRLLSLLVAFSTSL